MKNAKSQIKELRSKLDKWAKEYYDNNNSLVSDAEYDGVYNELVELEQNNPDLVTKFSITQRVGGKVDRRFEKVTHKYPMLSLSNAFNNEDVLKFDKQIKDLLHIKSDIEYVCELKIDGVSISVIYENGKLVKALTRGDGIVGEDVTHNILEVRDIPNEINYKNELEVRGEIYMSNNIFEDLNKQGAKFANPRNATAGSIRQLDSSVVEKRNLSSFMYQIPNALELGFSTYQQSLDFLIKNGFVVNKENRLCKSINEALKFISDISPRRKNLGYETDGVVIKVNDNSIHEDIGYTAKFPKYMTAFKFPEKIVQTKLLDIFVTIGRTGRVTYNAKLSPVLLAGSRVSAATLHNADYIKTIGINVGDIVEVKKAGEIIPKVLGVAKKNNNEKWNIITQCPACSQELKRSNIEVDQYCVNVDCPQILIAKLEHFGSKGAMNIDGVSTKYIKTFIKKGLVKDIPTLFELANKKEELLKIPGIETKLAENIIESVEKSKTQKLNNFIFGLGIRHVGSKNSKILSKRFGTLDNIMEAKVQDLISIKDLGEKVSESVVNYFTNEENRLMLKSLLGLGLKLSETSAPSSNVFSQKTFVITGTLSKSRKHFQNIIESNNGNVSSSISRNTNYLLAGKNAGSKLDKAKALKEVTILNEETFEELLRGQDD